MVKKSNRGNKNFLSLTGKETRESEESEENHMRRILYSRRAKREKRWIRVKARISWLARASGENTRIRHKVPYIAFSSIYL